VNLFHWIAIYPCPYILCTESDDISRSHSVFNIIYRVRPIPHWWPTPDTSFSVVCCDNSNDNSSAEFYSYQDIFYCSAILFCLNCFIGTALPAQYVRQGLCNGMVSVPVVPLWLCCNCTDKKGKGSTHSITERRVPELILVLVSQPTGDWVINPAVGCHYFPPGLQLPPQPLRGLLPVSLLGEQRHNGCEQFA